MNKAQIFNPEDEAIQISDLVMLIELEWKKADRAAEMLIRNRRRLGQQPNQVELDQVTMPYEQTAQAYEMVLKRISNSKIKNSVGGELATQLKIVEGTPTTEKEIIASKEVTKPTAEVIVTPQIKNPEIKKEADGIIADSAVEDSIAEAVRLAENKTSSEHWTIARDKVKHFYRGGEDGLPQNATEQQIDSFIRNIVDKVSARKRKELEETMTIARIHTTPITNIQKASSIALTKKGQFNYEIIGIGDVKGKAETEDKVKLIIIREMTQGNCKRAVNIAQSFYKSKNWSEFEATEFVNLLMKKDPHKELNTTISGILKDAKEKKGDPRRGVKFCRAIVAAYLGKKYFKGDTKNLTNDQIDNNKIIDRLVNRQLKELSKTA